MLAIGRTLLTNPRLLIMDEPPERLAPTVGGDLPAPSRGVKSIYWKPTLIWFIGRVRIIRPIRTQTKGTRPLEYGGAREKLCAISAVILAYGQETKLGKAPSIVK